MLMHFENPKIKAGFEPIPTRLKKNILKITQNFHLVSISASKLLTKLAQPYLP